MTTHDRIKLWVTTIETLDELVENEPFSEIPTLANKLRDVVEGTRDRFGELLVDMAMAGKLTDRRCVTTT